MEWARLLITLNRYSPKIWLIAKARYLFDVAVKQAWDPEHGGLAYSFSPDGTPCDPNPNPNPNWRFSLQLLT